MRNVPSPTARFVSSGGRWWLGPALVLVSTLGSVAACSSDESGEAEGDLTGAGATGAGATGSGTGSGGSATGSGGSLLVGGTSGSGATTGVSDAGFDACSGTAIEQEEQAGPLDIFFIFDRTASMGTDCEYQAGEMPDVDSKACYATYALADYLIGVSPIVDTRLAFQFMSLPGESCDGEAYSSALVELTSLPVTADHELIQTISDEEFQGGYGTEIEGALRGIAAYTEANVTAGREMIGVLMTDGDPNGCEGDVEALSDIVAEHLAATGIRTFIIGMEGATDENLELLGQAGGAEPHDDWCGAVDAPCHYWNVEDGSGDAVASALQAIIQQAAPLPCEYDVDSLSPPQGEVLDFTKVNVTLTDPDGSPTTIGWVEEAAACPTDQSAWYYDDPPAPTTIHLCPSTCELVTGSAVGSNVTVIVGCQDTMPVY